MRLYWFLLMGLLNFVVVMGGLIRPPDSWIYWVLWGINFLGVPASISLAISVAKEEVK